MQLSGDIGRRHHDGEWLFALFNMSGECTAFLPFPVKTVLDLPGIVRLLHFKLVHVLSPFLLLVKKRAFLQKDAGMRGTTFIHIPKDVSCAVSGDTRPPSEATFSAPDSEVPLNTRHSLCQSVLPTPLRQRAVDMAELYRDSPDLSNRESPKVGPLKISRPLSAADIPHIRRWDPSPAARCHSGR